MSAPLRLALRARFQRYMEEGLSGRAVALRRELSPATGARWAHLVRAKGQGPRAKGHAAPAPQEGQACALLWGSALSGKTGLSRAGRSHSVDE